MGQKCSGSACISGCLEGLSGALALDSHASSSMRRSPSRRRPRPVGLERRHTRRLRLALAREAREDVWKACDQRRGSPLTLPQLQDISVEAQDYNWQGTLRIGAKVSPACRSFDSEYEILDTVLGKGMNGSVMLARPRRLFHGFSIDDPDSDPPAHEKGFVAVKRLDKKGLSDAQLTKVLMEVDIYLKMDHTSIAKLLRVFNEEDQVYIVMEYCSGGALNDCLLKCGYYSEGSATEAVRQVLSAVNYCHCHPEGKICHRDLKHSNFLYASDAEGAPLKLVDFGLSRVLSPNRPQITTCAGTLYYMAPEVVSGQKYDQSCDLWSVGVITYSLLCGEPPFHSSTDHGVAKAITRAELPAMETKAWAKVSSGAKDFIRRLLQIDPTKRPTAEQALQHSWLAASRGEAQADGPQASVALSKDVLERVRCFAHESAVRRAAAALVVYSRGAPHSTNAQLLEGQFHALDVDGNGTISASELVQALQETLGITAEEASWIFSQLDIDGDTLIHHSEFLAAAMGAGLLQCRDTVREAFSRFDLDQDGKIELDELLTVLGPRFCGTPTHEIFRELDTNGDDAIDLDEFAFATCKMAHQDSSSTTATTAMTATSSSPFQPETEPPPLLDIGADVSSTAGGQEAVLQHGISDGDVDGESTPSSDAGEVVSAKLLQILSMSSQKRTDEDCGQHILR